MIKIYTNWENDNYTWNEEIRKWEEVYDIIDELIGGVKNPEEYNEMPYQQQEQINNQLREQLLHNLNQLQLQQQQKLIEVLLEIDGTKYQNKLYKNKKDIKITINDVKLIANDYLNIEIKFLK